MLICLTSEGLDLFIDGIEFENEACTQNIPEPGDFHLSNPEDVSTRHYLDQKELFPVVYLDLEES